MRHAPWMELGGTYRLMDALRCFAAIGVVFEHARSVLLNDSTPGMGYMAKAIYLGSSFGHEAVMMFFVLSGFWITKSVVGRANRPHFWRDYLLARLTRLWIVLAPALLVGGILDLVGIHVLSGPLYSGETGTFAVKAPLHFDAVTFLGNVVFLQALVVPTFGSNGPLWSLACEFWFYIWFPALWLAARHRCFSLALVSLTMGLLYPSLIAGFTCWLAGSLLYAALARGLMLPVPWSRLVFGIGMLATFASLVFSKFELAGSDLLIALSVALTLYGHAGSGFQTTRFIAPFSTYGEKCSFSLYAVHFPLVALITTLITPIRLPPTASNIWLLTAVTMTAVGFGWLFSLVTERHTTAARGVLFRLFKRPVPATQ